MPRQVCVPGHDLERPLLVCPSICSRRDQTLALLRAWRSDPAVRSRGLKLQVPAASYELSLPLCKVVSFTRSRAVSFRPSMLAPQLWSAGDSSTAVSPGTGLSAQGDRPADLHSSGPDCW